MYDFKFLRLLSEILQSLQSISRTSSPYFLVHWYWWRIEIDVTKETYDKAFIKYLDQSHRKGTVMLRC